MKSIDELERGRASYMDHVAVSYSLPGLDEAPHSGHLIRRVVFVPHRQLLKQAIAQHHRRQKVLIHDSISALDSSLAGRHWHVNYSENAATVADVCSTDRIINLLERGHFVWVIGGPFDSAELAHRDLDLRWESHP